MKTFYDLSKCPSRPHRVIPCPQFRSLLGKPGHEIEYDSQGFLKLSNEELETITNYVGKDNLKFFLPQNGNYYPRDDGYGEGWEWFLEDYTLIIQQDKSLPENKPKSSC